MDTNRESLKPNSTIELTAFQETEDQHQKEQRHFTIKKTIGYGASTIVYLAQYFEGGIQRKCILKELYPMNLYPESRFSREYDISREGVRLLQPWERDPYFDEQLKQKMQERFDRKKRSFRESFQIHADFFNQEEGCMDHLTSEPIGFYEGNGTLYAGFAYRKGICYANYLDEQERPLEADLRAILEIGRNIAEVVQEYHRHGYLHLDIKEENVFLLVAGEERHGVLLIDFDSLKKSAYFRELQPGQEVEMSYNGIAPQPPEIEKREFNKISEATDVFMLAAMLYRRITGKPYDMMPFLPQLVSMHQSRYLKENAVVEDQLKSFFFRALSANGRGGSDRPILTMQAMLRELDELLVLVQKEFAYEDNAEKRQEKQLRNTEKMLHQHSVNMFRILEQEGKRFHALKKFWYFENCLRLSNGVEQVSAETVFEEQRHIFLHGDGGLGKSTALYEYWKEQIEHPEYDQYCFYIELHDLYRGKQGSMEHTGSHVGDMILQHIADQVQEINDGKIRLDELEWIQTLFKKRSEEPEYTLLLDGLNEMTENDRSAFMQVLEYCITNWCNVRIIMTGRKIDRNLPKSFARYNLLGLNDAQKTEKLLSSGKYSEVEIEAMQHYNKPLWQLLSIPLFMNLFADMQKNMRIRTRGELLDAFVYSKIGSLDHTIRRQEDAEFRQFVLRYMVPFFANQMDRDHVDDISEEGCEECIERCRMMYLLDHDLPTSFVKQRYSKSIVDQKWKEYTIERIDFDEENNMHRREYFDVSVILRLLQESVCYIVQTYDDQYEFVHSYFREYFAAKHIYNVLEAAIHIERKKQETEEMHRARQHRFLKRYLLGYAWSPETCAMLGDITGDYRNALKELTSLPEKEKILEKQDDFLEEGRKQPNTETTDET